VPPLGVLMHPKKLNRKDRQVYGIASLPTLFEQVQQHACERPNHVAVWNRLPGGQYETTSYSELAKAARRFAQAFADSLSEARFIPLCLARSASCIAAMLGAIGAGKAFICVNPKMRLRQVSDILEAARASIVLVDAAGLLTLRGGLTEAPAITRVQWWLLREPEFVAMHERIAARLGAVAVVDQWQANVAEPNVPEPLLLPDDPLRVGCCLFTSGSTGKPKGVLIGERDLTARASAEAQWYQLNETDVLLNILPFSFDVGLNQVMSAMCVGCSLVLLNSWLPADILDAVSERQVTGISAVPSIWSDFLKATLRFDTRGQHASLRYITISGGDLSREKLDRLPAMLDGVGIIKTYGQTETFRSAALLPPEFSRKRQSVGRAFVNVRVYVVRKDGTLAELHEVGEIVHTGMGVMLGYLDGDDPQHKLRPNPFFGPDDDASFAVFTGDQGYLDEDGYLYLVGRRDEMLKVSGNRVYPREISDQLVAIAGVAEAEVVGVKLDDDDTHLVAFVVRESSRSLLPMMIRRELALSVPSFMLPEQVIILPALPRTANGKPDRQALAARAAALLPHK
jgi:acyl-coenzyme A synthetase/AMP-(fatty) acid ligase